MSLSSIRGCPAICFGVVAIVGCSTAAAWPGPIPLVQEPGQAAWPSDKVLEAAIQKIREGHNEDALGLIREQADKGQTDDARKLLQTATALTGAFAHREDAGNLLKSLKK